MYSSYCIIFLEVLIALRRYFPISVIVVNVYEWIRSSYIRCICAKYSTTFLANNDAFRLKSVPVTVSEFARLVVILKDQTTPRSPLKSSMEGF